MDTRDACVETLKRNYNDGQAYELMKGISPELIRELTKILGHEKHLYALSLLGVLNYLKNIYDFQVKWYRDEDKKEYKSFEDFLKGKLLDELPNIYGYIVSHFDIQEIDKS